MTGPSLHDLPESLIQEIIRYVPDYVSVCRLACTCHDFRAAAQDLAVWEALHRHRWSFLSLTLTQADYQRRHAMDQKTLQYLESLRQRSRSAVALRSLLMTGRHAVDACWKVVQATVDDDYRRLVRSVIVLLQRVSIFEDMVQLRRTAVDSSTALERLEGYAIWSSLLCCDTPYRNFWKEEDGVRKNLDRLADRIRQKFPTNASVQQKVSLMNQVMFEQEGYTGNVQNYYDFENSLLSSCLKRKTAIPMTLAILYKLVGARVGIDVDIIGLPGHIIVGVKGVIFLDVFRQGRLLTQSDIADIVRGYGFRFRPELLDALSPEDILKRVCNNLSNCIGHATGITDGANYSDRQRSLLVGLTKRLLYNPSQQVVESCHAELCRMWLSVYVWSVW